MSLDEKLVSVLCDYSADGIKELCAYLLKQIFHNEKRPRTSVEAFGVYRPQSSAFQMCCVPEDIFSLQR